MKRYLDEMETDAVVDLVIEARRWAIQKAKKVVVDDNKLLKQLLDK